MRILSSGGRPCQAASVRWAPSVITDATRSKADGPRDVPRKPVRTVARDGASSYARQRRRGAPERDDAVPETAPRNVPELFLDRVGRTPDAEAFRHPVEGGWRSLTWREAEERIRAIAGGLRALGLGAEQPCAILASTRIEWILADYGVLFAGGATSTIYPSSTAEECAFILADSAAAVAFAEHDEQVEKLLSPRAELSHSAWVAQSRAIQDSGYLDHPDVLQFFWLPLAHVFGKMIGTAQLRIGFPTVVDGRVEKIVENLAATRPTFVGAVPRIFEKMHAKILQGAREG